MGSQGLNALPIYALIISHNYRFIFIKTEKTAGTSLEIALSRYCGDQDVITPNDDEDLAIRQAEGIRSPQNYQIRFQDLSPRNRLKRLLRIPAPRRYWSHSGASYLQQTVAASTWKNYYKFSVERNPWDKVISYYWWRYNEGRFTGTLEDFVASGEAFTVAGKRLYTIDGQWAVDRVYRFEDLEETLNDLQQRLSLPEKPRMPHTKKHTRKDKRPTHEIFSPQAIEAIRQHFAWEIEHFGYDLPA